MTSTPITAADIANGQIDDALSVRKKIGYGLGDAGGTVITCLIMNFLTFFYTDVFGLTPALVGTLFIALRVFDAISDPVMGVIAVVMFLCCFFWVCERVPLSTMGKFTLREHLAGLRNNDQLLLMLVMSFLLINVFNIRGGGYMYFITYVLQGGTGYTSLFFTMVTFASIIGSVIVSPLTRRFDTVKIYYYTNLLLAALAVLMWFLPSSPAYQTLWLVVILGNGVILGFTLPLHFSLMAFADDYGEWKTRVRSSGMNFAFNLFFIKLAWASSAGIISLLFIFVAYQPGVENQTASSLGGITAMETLLPALFHLLLAMAIRFCKLNNLMMSRIASDLRQRHVQP
ncbi:MFS transporter [Escherichia albertii]|nr:MFS transporter [Escherichia albertii]